MRNKPLLMIDDDPDQLSLFVRLAREHGFKAETATSIEQGLEMLRSNGFGAVLLDLGMPGYAGTDAIDVFMQARPDVPIVVVSGRSVGEYAATCIAAGAQEFVQKAGGPCGDDFMEKILTAIVRHLVRGKYQPVREKLNEMEYKIDRLSKAIGCE